MENNLMPLYEITYGFVIDKDEADIIGEQEGYKEKIVQVSCCGGWAAIMDVAKALIDQLDGLVESPALVGVKDLGKCLTVNKESLAEIRSMTPGEDNDFSDDLAALHVVG